MKPSIPHSVPVVIVRFGSAVSLWSIYILHFPAFTWTPLLHALLTHGSAFLDELGPLGRLSDEPLEYYHTYFSRMVERSWGHRDISGAMQTANLVHHPKVRCHADQIVAPLRQGHHFGRGRKPEMGIPERDAYIEFVDHDDGDGAAHPLFGEVEFTEPVELLPFAAEEVVNSDDDDAEVEDVGVEEEGI